MNRYEFRHALAQRLADLPEQDRETTLSFFDEMIDDRLDEGMSEEAAVADLGSLDAIADRILSELSPLDRVKQHLPQMPRTGGQWALAIVSFPIWLPLLILFVALGFALVLICGALVLTLFIAILAFIVGGGLLLVTSPFTLFGSILGGLFNIGSGLTLLGLGLLLLPLGQRAFRNLNHRLRWLSRRRRV